MLECFFWIKIKYGVNENFMMLDVNLVFRDWNMGVLVFISVIILFGILGNFLVMVIFYREFKKLVYRMFVLWFVVLDFVGCFLVMLYFLVNIVILVFMDNEVVCKVGRFLFYVIMMMLYFILVVIVVDRYCKICKLYFF